MSLKTLSALAGAVALALLPALALAGPSDDLIVASQAHVDSPKVFWQGRNFTLNAEVDGKEHKLEKTVNWVGKGYKNTGQQQYVYEVPKNNSIPNLGEPGTLLYQAPILPGLANSPIWAGFGADLKIPAEKFRDGSFNLDMVAFDGPGKMDLFRYDDWMASSHSPGMRSVWIKPGTHTHNITTFTKPGNYHIQYRASARDKSGRFVASAPQTMTWQVGGSKPAPNGIKDVARAYDQAENTGAEGEARLTITPHEGREKDGDEYLTDMEFTTSTATAGTAIFYIDGYYLAEVPLKDGRATWSEMIGSETSSFQVVFIPKQGPGKWISSPLSYNRTQGTVSTTQPGSFPRKSPTRALPTFDNGDQKIADPAVSVTAKKLDNEYASIAAIPADKNLTLRVTGGFYDTPDGNNPSCEVEFISSPAQREIKVPWDGCNDGSYTLKLRLQPNSRTLAGANDISLGKAVLPKSAETRLTNPPSVIRKGDPLAAHELTESTPSPTRPAETEANPGKTGTNTEKISKAQATISDGHVDVRVTDQNGLAMALGDDSGTEEKRTLIRPLDKVTLAVPKQALVTRRGHVFASKDFDFLGKKGTQLYVLPQNQRNGLVWPGFSTESVDYSKYPKGIDIQVRPAKAPKGGAWWAFTQDLNGLGTIMAASDRTSTISTTGRIHSHLVWAFSKPGHYLLQVRAVDRATERATKWYPLRFAVDQAQKTDPATDPANSDAAKGGAADIGPTENPASKQEIDETVAPETGPAGLGKPSPGPTLASKAEKSGAQITSPKAAEGEGNTAGESSPAGAATVSSKPYRPPLAKTGSSENTQQLLTLAGAALLGAGGALGITSVRGRK